MADEKAAESSTSNTREPSRQKRYLPAKDVVLARLGFREMRTRIFWQHVVCEFVISMFLLYPLVVTILSGEGNPDHMKVAAVAGLTVYMLLEMFGHVQWANINPVVGLLFAVQGRISYMKGFFYFLADLAGAVAGTALALQASPRNARDWLESVRLPPDITPGQALISEVMITCALILVIIGALDHWNRKVFTPALPIGAAITAGVIVGGPVSKGILNPAIPFGIAVMTGDWKDQWVFWLGDYLGTVIAIILYHLFIYERGSFILMEPVKEKEKKEECDKVEDIAIERVE